MEEEGEVDDGRDCGMDVARSNGNVGNFDSWIVDIGGDCYFNCDRRLENGTD